MDSQDFWHWFEYMQGEVNRDPSDIGSSYSFLKGVGDQLHRYCQDLSIGVGTKPDGLKEMVITANGNVKYFQTVEELIRTAPQIDGWRFIALKPAARENFIVELPNGLKVNTEDIWFHPLSAIENPAVFAIRVYLKDYESLTEDQLNEIVIEVVQQMAGEKMFALDIDFIETAEMQEAFAEGHPIPIVDLFSYIKRYITEVQKQ